ncbi:hypothetical protein [Streptomyces sp. NBC_00102]|nr:hypothetical protein [Streptomyces sp. NBC_00102]MCX5396077.1 hypothetical protein [Streptomyces sp. NBC_00102]
MPAIQQHSSGIHSATGRRPVARKPLAPAAGGCQTPAMTYGIEQHPAL